MNQKRLSLGILALFSSCMQLPVESIPAPENASPSQGTSSTGWGAPAAPAKLYGFDGSPVQSYGPGSVTAEPKLGNAVQPGDGSRLYLLELYQQAMDSNDALAREVTHLNGAIEVTEASNTELIAERDDVRAQLAALTEERAHAEAQNLELAGRLTTAQIRRLEAEKLLLEATIEWGRLREMTRTSAAVDKTVGFIERSTKDGR
jgi:hypothetical protein